MAFFCSKLLGEFPWASFNVLDMIFLETLLKELSYIAFTFQKDS